MSLSIELDSSWVIPGLSDRADPDRVSIGTNKVYEKVFRVTWIITELNCDLGNGFFYLE